MLDENAKFDIEGIFEDLVNVYADEIPGLYTLQSRMCPRKTSFYYPYTNLNLKMAK